MSSRVLGRTTFPFSESFAPTGRTPGAWGYAVMALSDIFQISVSYGPLLSMLLRLPLLPLAIQLGDT